MRFVLASYGTRGDIEPSLAVGRELLGRGHEVQIGVPPGLVGFSESVGLETVSYGLDTHAWLDAYRDFWTSFFSKIWRIEELVSSWREYWEPVTQCWEEMSKTLTALAEGADVIFTSQSFQEPAANIAEHYNIPLATLHNFPIRANGQLIPMLPSPVGRSAMTAFDWVCWRLNKKAEDAQRHELGLPKAKTSSPRRIAERGSLEIQAYDEVCFPGLAAEWSKWGNHRPFVGSLTMELPTAADDEVASWIAAGTPPICFSFGSIAVESAAETVEMISTVCAELGERALICAAGSDLSDIQRPDHIKIVKAVNYAAIFPVCRAIVHHGGAGTTAASLRAGVPTLVLWTGPDQPVWGSRVKLLKVGTARRFSATTRESLTTDLRKILAPQYVIRAREVATQMTKSAESIDKSADLMEDFARSRCVRS
jgi:UDP:flavonoid glycosyltransferase YjiC (YdhE family)